MRVVLDGVFNHTGRGFWPFHHILETGADRRRTAAGSTSTTPASTPGAPLDRLSAAGMPPPAPRVVAGGPAATRRGGACPRCPSWTPTTRTCASTCSGSPSTGSASGSTAGDWTSRPRSTTRSFWQELPRPLPRHPPGRVSRRRDLASRAGLAARRPIRRPDELPARPRRSLHSPVGRRWTWRSFAATTNTARPRWPLDGPGFAARLTETLEAYDPDVVGGPAEPARVARRTPAADRHGRRRRRPSDSRRCSSSPCPAPRASTTATRSGSPAAMTRPAEPAFRGTSPLGHRACAAFTRDLTRLREREAVLRRGSTTIRRRGRRRDRLRATPR